MNADRPRECASSSLELPASALPAWRAFRAMQASKTEHLEFLEHLNAKYEAGGTPSFAESRRLAQLLEIHDQRVAAFSAAMKALAAGDPDSSRRLIDCLSTLNRSLGASGREH